MTDDQFERIKKGLNFHSEGGVYNLCTLTETALREIIEGAVKFYEKQQKIDAEQIKALQKQNGELTDELKAQIENDRDLPVIAYQQGAESYKRKADKQLTKAKEYIKLLLMNCVGVYESTGKTIAEIQAEAEQFLNEVEK